MINCEFSMSDTLDNFSFNALKSQQVENNSDISDTVSFNDSQFFENCSFDFEAVCNEEVSESVSFVNDKNKSPPLSVARLKTDSLLSQHDCTMSQIVSSNRTQITTLQKETSLDKPKNTVLTLDLSSWNLPETVLNKYIKRNVKTMFQWQFDCLTNPKVLYDQWNLIYSAPTSAGKTLVAEILALKTIFNRKKKVIFVLPFISIVREKMYYFQDILEGSGMRVDGFMGSYNPPGGFSTVHFAICTIEKANSLINRLLEENKLSEVGAVFIDEMHLVGDPSRGYLLELLLTKLRYVSMKDLEVQIQIIGMSATLPNLPQLAQWLGAELYSTSFRPIPLFEQICVDGEIYDRNFQMIKKLESLSAVGVDTDNVLQLCLDTIKESHSVLIFCPTKNWCENLAQQLSQAFFKIGNSNTPLGNVLRNQIKCDAILEVLEQLKFCPSGLDSILQRTVSFGIAFHHAGLTMDERDIIEGAFRNGIIKILAATSTLSSGVNLPARKVIIRSPIFCGHPLDLLTYRQMIGRAGRMGKDTQGESILICQKSDLNVAKKLATEELPAVKSCLQSSGKLTRAVLEVIASGIAMSPSDVTTFTNCTLLAVSGCDNNQLEDTIEYLRKNEFIKLRDQGYTATSLGKACLASSISPEEGRALFTELEKARQCFVLETELHLIYLVTPYSACYTWGNIDWMFYLDLWDKLPRAMKRVGELVGVRESFIVSATRGKIDPNDRKMLVHKRFFVALALQDLVNEVPLAEVCMKFNCNRGMLQGLQQSASTFAGMVTSFSKQLGWTSVEILLAQFQDRMQFGVGRDLLDLMQLPVLNGKLARILYKAGVETLVQLANQSVDAIEGILIKAKPFESSKIREGESENEAKKRTSLKTVWISGKDGLTEKDAADLLVKDARSYLVSAMGLKKATWGANRRGVNESSQSPRSKLSFQSKDNDILSKNTSPLDTSNFHDSYGTDESFSLQLSDDLSISDNDFETQNTFVKALERISLTQELASVDQEEHLAEKRNRSNYSDDSLLEATPKKKIKQVTADALNSTINRYTQNQNGTLQFANLCITKVGTLTKTKEEFICDLKNKDIISLGISFLKPQEKLNVNLFGNHTVEQQPKLLMAIYWGDAHAYYFPLTEHFTLLIQDFLKDNCKCIQIFNAKKWLKVLLKSNSEFNCKIEDPKVGDWLLDTDTREKHLKHMFSYYKEKLDEIRAVCNEIDKIKDFWSEKSTVREEVKVSVESILTWHLMDILTKEIREQNPKLTIRPLEGFTCSYELEMKMLLCTVKMEMAGLGVDTLSLQKLVDHLKEQQISIESKAYFLAGRRFNMASSKDVSKVIGTYNGKKISTKRKILEQNEHPISNLVLLWRKLNFTLVNIILPILRVCVNNRINGQYQNHTATGRITMHEPNIQMVPKNFDIVNPITEKNILINCRQVFQASQDCMLVSADYCQLELRILAYLSKDEILMGIMAKPGDIFKSIAAKWHNIPEIVVKDDMRNNVKQICYGIIYGMGINTLAEQMKISTEEAASLVETFRNTYIGIKKFVEKTIQFCKTHHYVETIAGRRRYLPNIVHADPSISGQAERQAVNTTVQGSAADIVKNAMLTIERKNDFVFKKSRFKPKLVLHLHDELIYEVSDKYLEKMVKIIKSGMENSCSEFGYFPVKVKTGCSWGQLKEYCDKI